MNHEMSITFCAYQDTSLEAVHMSNLVMNSTEVSPMA